jgi:PAS domain S-box-containing protein
MASSRKTNVELVEENRRLRAQVAQLEDKVDHLSEHGAAGKALQQSELLHRDVMGAVSDVVLIADDAGRLKYVSPNAHLIFGHSSADILKQGRISFVFSSRLFEADLLEKRGEISNIECEIRDSVGRRRDLLVTVRQLPNHSGKCMYVCRDVSERVKIELDYEFLSLTLEKRVEEQTRELRESRERYRRLVEGLRDEYLFYATDPSGVITYATPSIHTILGYTPDQVVGRNWREFVEKDAETLKDLERLEQMRFSGVATPLYCVPIPHANGEIRMLEFRDVPLRDQDGKVIANEGIGKDVTARHAAQVELQRAREELEERVRERTAELVAKNEQLRQSQDRYLSVIQDHLEFIIRWRRDGIRTFVNESYCIHCGASADELNGTSFMSSIVEQDKDELQQKLITLSAQEPVVVHEHRVVAPDGRTVWERWTHRALFNPDDELIEFQSIGCDITERRKREEHAQERAEASAKVKALTDREHDVMRLVVAGDANKVIARKLGLSIKTIEKHRSNLMKKLHVRSVPELVRFALLAESAE